MNVNDLLKFPKFTPLSVACLGEDCVRVGEKLCKIGEGFYIQLSRLNASFELGEHSPYMAGVLWATDDSAALRFSESLLEEDLGLEKVAPIDFWPLGVKHGYQDIVDQLDLMNKEYFESASYRIGSDGKFIYRQIDFDDYSVFFRKLRSKKDKPFAVLRRLHESVI